MTVSILRCCTSVRSGLLWRLSTAMTLLLAIAMMAPAGAYAAGIEVRKAETNLSEGNYQLSVDFDITLNFASEQALEQGVPLYFVSELTLTRPRWYWADEVVAQNEQTKRLSYNTLTRQYRISLGSLFQNFSTLDAALRVIGHQGVLSVPAATLKKGNNYFAVVRLRLDVTQLPKPLQVNALTSNEWDLDSGWRRWLVGPETTVGNRGE